MANTKKIPDDVASTFLPQLWHKPRGGKITSEPVMEMVFNEPQLSNTPPFSFKASLNEENNQYGLSYT